MVASSVMLSSLFMPAALASSSLLELHVDCDKGLDAGAGTYSSPFRSVLRAQEILRRVRGESAVTTAGIVHITGICELTSPLILRDAVDSNVRYIGTAGAMLSAGRMLNMAQLHRLSPSSTDITVDLKGLNFTSSNLGKLSGRGYSGGSACILINNFEVSPAELFYRPPGVISDAGARAFGAAEAGTMQLARFPNRDGRVPQISDWTGITSVNNLTLRIDSFTPKLSKWKEEISAGGEAWLHGLWTWNWADSHRPVLSISSANLTVGADDIDRDVNPIHARKPEQQGGYVYAYNLKSELDAPGEYYIDKSKMVLSFIPPSTAKDGGSYSISRLESVVQAYHVSNVTFENLEIRYSRGAGVSITDSTDVAIKRCTVSNHGMMGLNITGGRHCGIQDSEIAENGDVGVVLDGGDRITLTPAGHYIKRCTVHHNQRWIMNYAPDIFLGGVGNSVAESEIYGSPQIAVFMQGNDHTLSHSHIHDAGRQCSDCGAFYMGRDWTYRGNRILRTTFSNLSSIFPKAHGQTSAVYLDDQLSSVDVEGCLFDNIEGRLLELGGGRNNRFVNNIVKQSLPTQSMSMDIRGGGGTKCCAPGKLPFSFLARVPYNASSVWTKYPLLANILNDDPCTPKYNVISNNVLCGGVQNFSLDAATVSSWGSEIKNNTVMASCPGDLVGEMKSILI